MDSWYGAALLRFMWLICKEILLKSVPARMSVGKPKIDLTELETSASISAYHISLLSFPRRPKISYQIRCHIRGLNIFELDNPYKYFYFSLVTLQNFDLNDQTFSYHFLSQNIFYPVYNLKREITKFANVSPGT